MLTRIGFRQSGQATIVAVLVTLVLMSVMAGVLTSGTSSLLSQQSPPRQVFEGDIDAQNALAAAVSLLPDQYNCPTSSPPDKEDLWYQGQDPGQLPSVDPFPHGASCQALGSVDRSSAPGLLPISWGQAHSPDCGLVKLGPNRIPPTWYWFSARSPQDMFTHAYVDTNWSGPCDLAGSDICDATAGESNGLVQLSLSCQDDQVQDHYLHIYLSRNSDPRPNVIRSVAQVLTGQPGGVIYNVAAPGGDEGGRVEEADIWADSTSLGTLSHPALRWEAAL